MAEGWYYVKGEGTVGPITLDDLQEALGRQSNAARVLVWKDGFQDWAEAGTVAEIARTVTGPPPLPTARAVNPLDQLDDFWREALQSNAYDQTKYTDMLKRLQAQVAHLPQAEQDKFFMPFVTRNAEYIAIAKRDKDALRVRLGLPISSRRPVNTNRLAQVAAETAVRATVWQSIAMLFRGFR